MLKIVLLSALYAVFIGLRRGNDEEARDGTTPAAETTPASPPTSTGPQHPNTCPHRHDGEAVEKSRNVALSFHNYLAHMRSFPGAESTTALALRWRFDVAIRGVIRVRIAIREPVRQARPISRIHYSRVDKSHGIK